MSYTSLVTCTCNSTLSPQKVEVNNFCGVSVADSKKNCKSALSEKLDNIGLRAVIRYLHLKGLPEEVLEDMCTTPVEVASFYCMVTKWNAHFKCGRER